MPLVTNTVAPGRSAAAVPLAGLTLGKLEMDRRRPIGPTVFVPSERLSQHDSTAPILWPDNEDKVARK